MIPSPSADFTAQEARLLGAMPVLLPAILPYCWPSGISAQGTFQNASYVAPDKFQADYLGFASGYGITPVLMGVRTSYPVSAIFTLDYNTPGYTMALWFRSAFSIANLLLKDWTALTPGDVVEISRFYQWKVVWEGYRCWAQDPLDPEDDFTAWAVDDPDDPFVSYACNTVYPFDSNAYVRAALITGEYPIPPGDIESGGSLSQETPRDFSGIVAGSHTLTLNNRHGYYSPLRSNFIFADEDDWFRRKLRLDLAYVLPGTDGQLTDRITLYLGEIRKWGPLPDAIDAGGKPQSHTNEIFSKDLICQLLEVPIGLPDPITGLKTAIIHGEYLAAAEQVVGRALAPPQKTITFEQQNLDEFDNTLTSGGGTLTIIPDATLGGLYSLRTAVTGANQSAYGISSLAVSGSELFATFPLRWQSVPGTPIANNLVVLKILQADGSPLLQLGLTAGKKLLANWGGDTKEGDWNIGAFEGIKANVSIWANCIAAGGFKVWVNGSEVLNWTDINLSAYNAKSLLVGAITGASAESWTIDFGDIKVGNKYHSNAYQVAGFPFQEIKTAYVDEIARAANYELLPEYGTVNFTDAANPVSGEVLLRVVADSYTHFVDIVQKMLQDAGLTSYLNTASFAAAKLAVPDDLGGVNFTNTTLMDALKEIASRCLYYLFVDHGEIKILSYSGLPPSASPFPCLGPSEIREISSLINSEDVNNGVVVKYGWFDHNPDLVCRAGDQAAQLLQLDLSYGSPVATENSMMAQNKADLALKRLSLGEEMLEPVRTSLRLARVELLDALEINNPYHQDVSRFYPVAHKEISLGRPWEVNLRLLRPLGES